jgi:fibronectin type 3 domain-containing protein
METFMERTSRVPFYLYIIFIATVAAASFGVAHAQVVGKTLPSVPTGVTATAVPPSEISLSWTAAVESSGTIEGYDIYRNGNQITTTPGTSITDAGLPPGFYTYSVAAFDANGITSAHSSVVSVSLTKDTTPPSVPTGITITGTTSTNSFYTPVQLTISWSASTDNVGVVGYYVYRNGLVIGSSTSAITGTSVTDTVAPGTYTYTVAAYDAAQNISNKSTPTIVTVSVDTNPPTTPTNVSVQQLSASGVTVSWATSTDSIGVAGYQVYRDGIQIATVAGSPYADTGLFAGNAYRYAVAAYDSVGNTSQPSSPVTITVLSDNGPNAPDIISAAPIGTSTIKISWVPGGDILPITDYTVYRNNTFITSMTSTSYLDTGLSPGIYIYNVSQSDTSNTTSPTSSPATAFITGVAAATSTSIAITPIVVTSSSSDVTSIISSILSATSTIAPLLNSPLFTGLLSFGTSDTQVHDLQSLLAQYGYLSSTDETGFFGNLTLRAIETFQCNQNIVCTGGAGWGTVGPKTRSALNKLEENISSSTSSSALNSELQTLLAELGAMEAQVSSK